jgi:hypothetical protein
MSEGCCVTPISKKRLTLVALVLVGLASLALVTASAEESDEDAIINEEKSFLRLYGVSN